MKIRTGFVSNSSSSSFALGKNFLTEEQVLKFRDWVKKLNNSDERDSETWIGEVNFYFMGEVGQDDYDKISYYLKSIGVDEKYAEFYC